MGGRTTVVVVEAVESTPTRTTAVRIVAVTVELGTCDLCAQHGITTPATSEARMPGGVWASLCRAHAHRAQSAGLRVLEADTDTERSAA